MQVNTGYDIFVVVMTSTVLLVIVGAIISSVDWKNRKNIPPSKND